MIWARNLLLLWMLILPLQPVWGVVRQSWFLSAAGSPRRAFSCCPRRSPPACCVICLEPPPGQRFLKCDHAATEKHLLCDACFFSFIDSQAGSWERSGSSLELPGRFSEQIATEGVVPCPLPGGRFPNTEIESLLARVRAAAEGVERSVGEMQENLRAAVGEKQDDHRAGGVTEDTGAAASDHRAGGARTARTARTTRAGGARARAGGRTRPIIAQAESRSTTIPTYGDLTSLATSTSEPRGETITSEPRGETITPTSEPRGRERRLPSSSEDCCYAVTK